jgi:hypothetical protein
MPRGRPKGSPNQATALRERVIASQGTTPLAYMLAVLRDETQPREVRMDAAKSAAPYVHPRLANVQAQVETSVRLYDWLIGEAET